jgi:hypothetical protein
MRLILIIVVLLISVSGFSQQQVYSDSTGLVVVKKDPRLDILSAKQSEINRRAAMMNITHARGYRIQVINTQNRDDANNVKAEMLRRFPEHKAYLLYKAPNFRVRVGNFLSQRDAESTRKMIAALYPNRGIYLVSDMVEYKPKEDEDFTGME